MSTPSPSSAPAPQSGYGWWIALVAFLMLTISNGMTLSGLTVFDAELIKTFSCTREALKRGELIQLLSAGLLAPLIGYLADRSSLRVLIIFGLALLSGGLYGYSQVTSLNQLYLIRGAFGVSLACAGLVMAVLMVSRWFRAKRGLNNRYRKRSSRLTAASLARACRCGPPRARVKDPQ